MYLEKNDHVLFVASTKLLLDFYITGVCKQLLYPKKLFVLRTLVIYLESQKIKKINKKIFLTFLEFQEMPTDTWI